MNIEELIYKNNIFMDIKFYFKLQYYKYFNPYIINHYNVINKLLKFESISETYYNKYPNANSFGNLSDKLFESNHNAKEEYKKSLEIQEKIKKSIINDIKMISDSNKKYEINSEYFQSFYIDKDYHIGQYIDSIVDFIKNDIIKNDIV